MTGTPRGRLGLQDAQRRGAERAEKEHGTQAEACATKNKAGDLISGPVFVYACSLISVCGLSWRLVPVRWIHS